MIFVLLLQVWAMTATAKLLSEQAGPESDKKTLSGIFSKRSEKT